MKKTLLIIPAFLAAMAVNAQTTTETISCTVGTGTVANTTRVYDSGGRDDNYKVGENTTKTFVNPDGFINIKIGGDWGFTKGDTVKIYDGDQASSASLIWSFTGYDEDFRGFTSTRNSVTIVFATSPTNTVTSFGYDFRLTCSSVVGASPIVTGQTNTACEGNFYDNGGAKGNIKQGESSVTTICSGDDNKTISASGIGDLRIGAQDVFLVYDGNGNAGTPMFPKADDPENYIPNTIKSTGQCLTFEYKALTTSTVTSTGWDIKITCETKIGINELSSFSAEFALLGNPVNSKLEAQLNANHSTNYTISILDLQGRIIKTETLNAATGVNNVSVDVSSIQSGLYFVRVSDEVGSIQKKFVVQQ